tara:strand:- start:319 stop:507 length:189 start_codon:yes stop_codon:yes gene_type:complete
MGLSDDPRNITRGNTQTETNDAGEHGLVAIEITIEADQWEAIKNSSVEAAMFVAWLSDHITE